MNSIKEINKQISYLQKQKRLLKKQNAKCNLPNDLIKSFSEELKTLTKGFDEKIVLKINKTFTIPIHLHWEDADSFSCNYNYNIHTTAADFNKKFDEKLKCILKKHDVKIKSFMKRFETACKKHNLNKNEEFDRLLNGLKNTNK